MERHDLGKALFDKINAYLSERALLLRRGTIVDASIIHAPNSSQRTRERHAEMSRTRKGSQVYFGMKMHIGVDAESGLVHTVVCTKASINDIERVDALCHGKEQAVFGDKGYAKQALKKRWRSEGKFYGILDKAERYYTLSSRQLKRNRKLSSLRAKVEHPFRIVKHVWGYRKIRYCGLLKNANQVYLLFGLSNLYLSKQRLGVAVMG